MKTILLSFAFLFMSGLAIAKVKIPVCFPCEEIKLVEDLPDDEDLKEGLGFLDVGYYYKEYGAVFIPVWNSDGEYVLYSEASDVYYELTPEQLEELKTMYNLDLPENPLSFWEKFGGKILLLILIGLLIYGSIGGDDEDEIVEETDATDKDPVVIIKEDDKPTA